MAMENWQNDDSEVLVEEKDKTELISKTQEQEEKESWDEYRKKLAKKLEDMEEKLKELEKKTKDADEKLAEARIESEEAHSDYLKQIKLVKNAKEELASNSEKAIELAELSK